MSSILSKRPLIISGPCSAESEEQVLRTAHELATTGRVDIFRAGVWKPRTKPGMFEGVGAQAFDWLRKVQQATGLKTTIEVANARQTSEALEGGTDVLWIGARTVANPFSVQEIAEALSGVDVPVLVKNPVNPDLELWAGAIERLRRVGISAIGMIHRGFSTYSAGKYRNEPLWRIAIDMKLRYPEFPMLCDPSHICGRRGCLQDVAQRAIDLHYDGLMIESHFDPSCALSDALQQVTPAGLDRLLAAIQWRRGDVSESDYQLEEYRRQIDELDDELLKLLGMRMAVSDLIGEYKKQQNITIFQPVRWSEIIDRVSQTGARLGLNREFIVKYLEAIHMESIRHQKSVMDGTREEE